MSVETLSRRQTYPLITVKSADQTVNNSATLVDDTDLQFDAGVDETWIIEIDAIFISGTTPDIKVTMTLPANATFDGRLVQTVAVEDNALLINGTGAEVGFFLRGIVRMGDTLGAVKLQWAQNTANATDTKILAKSTLRRWRV